MVWFRVLEFGGLGFRVLGSGFRVLGLSGFRDLRIYFMSLGHL